jgi:NADH-quinone oxidoreductase subunit K
MTTVPLSHALLLSGVLFAIGLSGVITRRNMILVLLSAEIMLNAAGLAFVAAGSRWLAPDGQIMFLFILAAAAVEVSIGLALVLRQSHLAKSLDIDAAGSMKG